MELWSHKSYFVSIKLNGSPVFNGHSISTCIVHRYIDNGNEAMQRKRNETKRKVNERKRIVKKGSGATGKE